ncbi:MAG: RHS repeat protein, partial [Chlamydiales bacterium]|nr:RHS repeat protein [Chlamydiales bacterium]
QKNGGPLCEYRYDEGGRPLCYTERVEEGVIKTLYSKYDAKGRLLSQSDDRGNATEQAFDSFGRCLCTTFSTIHDEERKAYRPQAFFSYDCQGNVISSSNPQKETTLTSYTTYKKPQQVRYPDQTQISYTYTKEGLLTRIAHADGSKLCFTYDPLSRLTSKKLSSPQEELLEQELWEYDSFHLISYTDSRGLKTTYSYNWLGQKIGEESLDRVVTFEYDSLGFLSKIQRGEIAVCQRTDVGGKILEKWEEDLFGHQKNYTRFEYDFQGRKKKAICKTSLGESVDLFSYDREGRLCKHIDPLGSVTEYIETKILNDLDQYARQTIEIDPLGNQTIETYDALNHLICTEKRDKNQNILFCEKLLYDRSCNLAKRISFRYEANNLIDSAAIEWKHDPMGRMIFQKLPDGSMTLYAYDARGNPSEKRLPSGDTLFYTYDARSRLCQLQTSDGSLHYLYHYDLSDKPYLIEDLKENLQITRRYNPFGELIEEESNGLQSSWHYDTLGRCDLFTLPDGSHISYLYEGLYL